MANAAAEKTRRTLRYDSYDDLLADAEAMAASDVTTVGKWSLGQNYDHLARSLNGSIDGIAFKLPFPARVLARLLMKNKLLNHSVPSGFKIAKSAKPQIEPLQISTEEGLGNLREAINRVKSDSERAFHPAFGAITTDEWDRFNLRHAEMHMSHIVPEEQ